MLSILAANQSRFIYRLLAEGGICFFFEHSSDAQLMVFGGSTVNYQPISQSVIARSLPGLTLTDGLMDGFDGQYLITELIQKGKQPQVLGEHSDTPQGRLCFKLPGHNLHILVRHTTGAMAVAPANMDTLIIEPDAVRAHLVWRAVMAVEPAVGTFEARLALNPAAVQASSRDTAEVMYG